MILVSLSCISKVAHEIVRVVRPRSCAYYIDISDNAVSVPVYFSQVTKNKKKKPLKSIID